AVLKDGNHEITIDQAGNVVGLPPLSSESRQAVKDALTSESLTRPNVLEEVASADVSTRAPNEKEERIKIVSPAGAVIVQDRPILRWISSKTANAYRLEIADETFRQVAKSDELPMTAESWSPTISLKRGQIYTWTIRAVTKGGDLSPLSSQGKFKILGE